LRRKTIIDIVNVLGNIRDKATPADIETWTEGRALIGVGSPFPPITPDGSRFRVDQTNNRTCQHVYPNDATHRAAACRLLGLEISEESTAAKSRKMRTILPRISYQRLRAFVLPATNGNHSRPVLLLRSLIARY